MSEIRTTKIGGQEFVTLTDYLRLKEEKQELEYLGDINEELKEENKKLKDDYQELKSQILCIVRESKRVGEDLLQTYKDLEDYVEVT